MKKALSLPGSLLLSQLPVLKRYCLYKDIILQGGNVCAQWHIGRLIQRREAGHLGQGRFHDE